MDQPTQVNSFPGGWCVMSKLVKATRIMKMIGRMVNMKMPREGRASSVLWNWWSARAAMSSLAHLSFLPEARICWLILF